MCYVVCWLVVGLFVFKKSVVNPGVNTWSYNFELLPCKVRVPMLQ